MIDLTQGLARDLPHQRAFSTPSATSEPADGLIRLVPLADLDLSTEATARAELAEACEAPGGYHWVVVDSVPAWFVDVRGLAVLIDSAENAAAHGRELVVVAPPNSLQQSVTALSLGEQLRLIGNISELTAA